MFNWISSLFAGAALDMAIYSVGLASGNGMHQMKEPVPSQQKWTQKSFKKRNESQYFVNLRKPTAFIPRFA